MEKILVNKELLSNYKSLLIVLENCDVYEIAVDDIIDIFCVAEPIDKDGKLYRSKDGFIKIAARASQTIERSISKDHKIIGTKLDCRLKERLEMLHGGVDMTSFSLSDKKKSDIDIYVPYDALEDVVLGGEIELSNCPSLEIDNEGNMIIAFGKSSKQPKRKDNNYAELIEGWHDAFGDFAPKTLKVKVESLSTFGDPSTNLSFSFKVCNKAAKKDFAEFVFMDCKDLYIEMSFPQKGSCEIFMSKMADGNIYVGFPELGISFICSSIQEYEHYCSKDDK